MLCNPAYISEAIHHSEFYFILFYVFYIIIKEIRLTSAPVIIQAPNYSIELHQEWLLVFILI